MKILHLISQAHLDPVWLWPWTDGAAEVLTTVQSAMDRATENPDFRFTRASAATYRWLKEMDPRLFAQVRRLVQEGRWEVVGGWIEQPDCNLPSTESFVRHSLYGKKWLENEFGVDVDIGYNIDSFGHSGGLPQLLRHAGFRRYVFMRPDKKEAPGVPDLFWWESPDGSRVLTQRVPENYSQSPETTADGLERLIRENHARHFSPGFNDGLFFFGVGNHGGGPTREHIARILELQRDSSLPHLRFSTLADYFEAVEKTPAAQTLPVWHGDLQYHARGCYSATGEVKRLNRRAEKSLFVAESAQVAAGLAGLRGFDQPALGEAWWRLLLNQFHDVLAGSCVASVWPPVRDAVGGTCAAADELATKAALRLARCVDTRGEQGGVLFLHNPLPWPRKVTVQTDAFSDPHGRAPITHLQTRDGKKIPLQWMRAEAHFGPWLLPWQKLTAVVELPALGYRVLRLAVGTPPKVKPAPAAPFRMSGHSLGLESWRSRDGVELLSAPLGLVVMEDLSDTWAHNVDAFTRESGRPNLVESAIVESGPLRTVYRQKAVWRRSEIWVDFTQDSAADSIELRFRINWQERRQLLKLEIPTTLTLPRVVCRSAGGVSARPFTGDEQPQQDWVALTGKIGSNTRTLALLNEGSYSYSCEGSCLRAILVRSTPYAEFALPADKNRSSWVKSLRRAENATILGARVPDDAPEPFTDQGWQDRRFALVEKRGNAALTLARLDREAEAFQVKPLVFMDSAHPGTEPWEETFLSVGPATVSVLAVKPAEGGKGFIVRLQDMSGRADKVVLNLGGQKAINPIRLGPWQIKTLHVCPSRKGWRVLEVDALENNEHLHLHTRH